MCDEIINATGSVLTNLGNIIPITMSNTISANVANTVSINSDDAKVRSSMDCYVLHFFISDYIIIHNCYYLPSLYKTLVKTNRCTNYIKVENNALKKFALKIAHVIIFIIIFILIIF